MSYSQFAPITSANKWHETLMNLPQPHALQSWVWGDFKSRWGWTAQTLAIYDEYGVPQAAALVLRRRLPQLPFSILYVPKGPILDYENEPLRAHVLAQLESLARDQGAIFIKIDPDVDLKRGPEPGEEVLLPTGQHFSEELVGRGWRFSDDQIQFRNTVELDLTPSEDELLQAMKSKTRYNIRYAGRKDVVVAPVTPDAFGAIAAMYEKTADRNEFAIRPQLYYEDAWHSFYDAGMAQPFLATYEGTPLGAVIIVRYGERALYMYGASNNKERNRQPNYLLQWEAIRWAKAQGCRVYDFWGAPDEFVESDSMWGVWRFKSGFGADVVHHVGAWDFPARRFWYWVYSRVIPRYLAFLRRQDEG